MARCRRCGTVYADGMRHCPKCGEPENGGKGVFAAPQPVVSQTGQNNDGAPKRKSPAVFWDVPPSFAVIVVGLLLNPALRDLLITFYFEAAALCGAEPRQSVVLAISFIPNIIGMAVVAIVLEQFIHSRRKGTALKVAAAALFVLTIFSIINAIHRFVEFAAF